MNLALKEMPLALSINTPSPNWFKIELVIQLKIIPSYIILLNGISRLASWFSPDAGSMIQAWNYGFTERRNQGAINLGWGAPVPWGPRMLLSGDCTPWRPSLGKNWSVFSELHSRYKYVSNSQEVFV